VLSLFAVSLAAPAIAQDGPSPSSGPVPSRAKPVSPNATINLVNLLVKQGILTEDQAAKLIKEASDEAYIAQQAAQDATKKSQEAEKTANTAAASVSPPGTKHVTYVPEIVKRDMREEIRKEVLDQAKRENWAAPNTFPEWVSRIRVYGDVRLRYEKQLFPQGNDTTGQNLYNWNAINAGSGLNFNRLGQPFAPIPTRDVDQNRQRFRLRARLGLEADLKAGFSAGIRIATGDNNSPVSTNETLGGGGGNFSKSSIWLDRAWLRYAPVPEVTLNLGRFDNPFYAPTDLVWYNELGFDGAAVQAKYEAAPGLTPFFVGGAFPLYNTLLNYPNAQISNGTNLPSEDKYLFGVQTGALWHLDPDIYFNFGVAYYHFTNVQGQLSAPCDTGQVVSGFCSTDALRPSFAQFGNTYRTLRDLTPYFVENPAADAVAPQYFGLASSFHVLELTGRLDLTHFNPVHVMLDGTYVNNLAFNKDQIGLVAYNNLGPSPAAGVPGSFAGGNVGAMGRITVGRPELKELWDWSVFAAYKYLESDAVIDAFTDPDFGLGGTNLKGYIVGGALGLGPNVWATARWMSANSIVGAPFAVDVFLLDLNGRF
jgi:hypothetical protein